MSRPWMPLYVADYLADTMHFSAAEHGAYLLLIMHYWANGGLPDDDARLARIVRMSDAEWAAARAVIRPKFGDGWRHARIDGELAESARLAEAGKKGGEASGEARRQKRQARPKGGSGGESGGGSTGANDPRSQRATIDERFAKQTANDLRTIHEAPQPQAQESDGKDARAREAPPGLISAEAHSLAAAFLREVGFADPLDIPPEFAGIAHRAQVWIASGWGEQFVLLHTRKIMDGRPGPPHPNYFEKVFANAFAALDRPVPEGQATEKIHAKNGGVIAAADRLVDRIRQFDQPAPAEGAVRLGARAPAVRSISQG